MESVESLTKTTLDEIEKVLNAKAVVGEPISVEGATLIPLVSIGFGFGVGGGTGKSEEKAKGEGTGGGTGGGAGVRPVAMIIVDKSGVRVEPIIGGLAAAMERIGESVPRIMERCAEMWEERRKRREE